MRRSSASRLSKLARLGRTPAELAREFGMSAQTVTNSVTQAAIDACQAMPGKDSLSSAERSKPMRRCRANRCVQQQRDILAKASA